MIQADSEVQLQIINSQSLKCSASDLSCSSLMSLCQENSCSKSDQEKSHLQSQNSSVSQEHAQSYNRKKSI